MRLTTVILLASLIQVSASTLAQKITLSEKNAPLVKVFEQIRAQSGFDFMFNSATLKDAKQVTIAVKNAGLKQVLDEIFDGQPLTYEIAAKSVIVSKKVASLFDRFSDAVKSVFTKVDVRGKILDENGKPLEGATIVVKGTSRTAKTDAKGEFVIPNVPDDAVLVIRFVGYKTLEIPVKGVAMPLEIKLNVQTGELEEVAINTGYQTISKERFVGSYSQLDSAAFHRRAGMGILERLDGTVTGVLFNKKVGAGIPPIQIRGISSLGGGSGLLPSLQAPLIVVDNFPMDARFDLNSINPNDVENVTVLKDAAAASIWGAKAGNGVVVITTKKGKYNQRFSIAASSNVTITEKPDLFYIPRISTSDFIDIEQDLFNKGFYDNDINNTFS